MANNDTSVNYSVNATDNTGKAFDSAARNAEKMTTGVASSSKKAESAFSSIGKVIAGVFTGNALSEGVSKVFDFVKEGVKDAADFEQAFAGVKTAMKNAGVPPDVIDAQEKFITSMSNTVGVSKESLLPAYQKMFLATGNVKTAQQGLSDALDLSKAAHIPLTAAVKALSNGYNGQTTALKKYGVEVDKGTKGSQLLADVQKKVGGAAMSATQTAAGQYQKLQTNLANMKEEVGEKLLPVLTQAATKLEAVLPSVEKFASGVITGFGQAVTWVQRNKNWLLPITAGIAGAVAASKGFAAFQSIKSDVSAAVGALAKLLPATAAATAAQGELDVAMDANPIGIIVTAIGALTAGLIYFFTQTKLGRAVWSDFTQFMGKAVKTVAPYFTDLLPAAFLTFKAAAEGAIGMILTAVGNMIHGFGSMLSVLGRVPGFGWAKTAAKAVDGAADSVTGLGKKLTTTSNKDVVNATNKVAAFDQAVRHVPNSTLTKAEADVTAAQNNVNSLKHNYATVPASKKTTVAAEVATAEANLNRAKQKLDAIKSKTVNVNVSAPKSVTIPLRTNTIEVTTSAGQGVMTLGSKMIALAQGGYVTKPTIALVGESGPEAVIPLNSRRAPAIAQQPAPVNVYVTPLVKGLDIRDMIRLEIEQNGSRQALDLGGGVGRRVA